MDIKELMSDCVNLRSLSTQIKYLTDSADIGVEDCLFIMIDIQEKFRGIIHELETVVKNSDILNKASEILKIPLIVTEHVPEKLGKTLTELYVPENVFRFEKTRFSVFDEKISEFVESMSKPVLVIYGIEAHICILQSCLDAIKRGYHVLLVADAISSRKEYNKDVGIKMLSQKGVEIVTTEMLLFRLIKDAKYESFKDIAKLIK